MKKYYCQDCLWEGNKNELKVVMKDNEINLDDKTLYEVDVCPICESENYIKDE